jgi:hypothetical protein
MVNALYGRLSETRKGRKWGWPLDTAQKSWAHMVLTEPDKIGTRLLGKGKRDMIEIAQFFLIL